MKEENAWPGPGRSVPFYVAHGVDEVLVVEPDERRASVYVLEVDRYSHAERSALLGRHRRPRTINQLALRVAARSSLTWRPKARWPRALDE